MPGKSPASPTEAAQPPRPAQPPRGPIAPPLLAWFAQNRRHLPFREDPTPYHIWVSEIMLQQTRMSAAVPYYLRFMERLPTVQALAACPEDELAKLWEGLGYYSRMRNLQKAARLLCREYGGALPADYEALRALPGVGEYTAGAIASIGFGLAEPAVDGNVLRVFSRLWRDESDVAAPGAKELCAERVRGQQPPDAPGDFNQALMELGALVCLPGAPECGACPLAALCSSCGTPDAARLPVKAPRPPRRVQAVTLLAAECGGRFLLQRRGEGGLLAGLWQPPLWEEALSLVQAAEHLAALGVRVQPEKAVPLPGAVHKFTHVEWQIAGWRCPAGAAEPPAGWVWATREEIESRYALPGALKSCRRELLKSR